MWKCSKCKEKIEDNFDSCWSCGTTRDGSAPTEPFEKVSPVPSKSSSARRSSGTSPGRHFTFVGIFVGTFVGFLLRPAVPLVGQLPFLHCITAGATLEGLGANGALGAPRALA